MSRKKRPTDDELHDLLFSGYEDQSKDLPAEDPIMPSPMVLSIDEIEPYELNPRRARNEAWEEILHSLRASGYRGRFTVTRRPGERHYIPAEGGNTTLMAMKQLAAEGDERFLRIPVEFVPWSSEADTLVAHLVENDARADLIFIDKARALRDAREQIEKELGKKLSQRALVKELSQRGFKTDPSQISRYEYTLEVLEPALPQAFLAGAGQPLVKKLRQLETVADRLVQRHRGEADEAGLRALFQEAMMAHDAPEPDTGAIQEELIRRLGDWLDLEHDAVHLEFETLLIDPEADLDALHAGQEAEPGLSEPVSPSGDDSPSESKAAPAAERTEQNLVDETSESASAEHLEHADGITEQEPSSTAPMEPTTVIRPATLEDLNRPGTLDFDPETLLREQPSMSRDEWGAQSEVLFQALRDRTRHLAELGVSPFRNPHTEEWDELNIVELVYDSTAGMGVWIDLPWFNMGNDRYAPGGGWGHQCWIWWHIASATLQFHLLNVYTAEYRINQWKAHERGEPKPRMPRLVEDYLRITHQTREKLPEDNQHPPMDRMQMESTLQRASGFVMQRPYLYQSLDMSVSLVSGDRELVERVRHFDALPWIVWAFALKPDVLGHPEFYDEDLQDMARQVDRMKG